MSTQRPARRSELAPLVERITNHPVTFEVASIHLGNGGVLLEIEMYRRSHTVTFLYGPTSQLTVAGTEKRFTTLSLNSDTATELVDALNELAALVIPQPHDNEKAVDYLARIETNNDVLSELL